MNEQPVLLVEDNADDELLTVRVLKKSNIHNVVVARDGVEALDYLFSAKKVAGSGANPRPSFILLDLKLPRMDGLECLLAIRADERTRDIPVIIITSSKDERDMKQSGALRVKGYLNKPLDPQQLAETLDGLGISYQT
jgi:two-component system, response regulator